MHVCCGLTNHLELAKRPDLYGGAVIVGEWEEHVIAASEEALPFGVTPGMPLRQAEHLCPQATFIAPDPIAASRLRELISIALYDLAPVVEVRVEGIAWLDVSGVVKPGESIREARRRLRTAIGREPRLGFAPGPFSARVAAARARCVATSQPSWAFVGQARSECECDSSTNQTSLTKESPPSAIRFPARPSCSGSSADGSRNGSPERPSPSCGSSFRCSRPPVEGNCDCGRAMMERARR